MSIKDWMSYYGRMIGQKPTRPLVDDLIGEWSVKMGQEMKEMEERLRKLMHENKREIIKEMKAMFVESVTKSLTKKEAKNVK